MNTQEATRNGSDINMSEPYTNNNTERFIHVGRVDLENRISYNESERCRLVSKIQQYNAMVNDTWYVFPMKATRVVCMPFIHREQYFSLTEMKSVRKRENFLFSHEKQTIMFKS